MVTSALSQQISRLESELATRLLQRTSRGVVPTDAGLAFLRQAQLALRHADEAVRSAREARLSGQVSVGFAPSTAAVLGVPFIAAMRERYPNVRLRLVETLSGNLGAMLDSRRLDLAVLFETASAQRWSALPLLDERLFLIGVPTLVGLPAGGRVRISRLGEVPLVLPSGAHGLRAIVDAAFARARVEPVVALEVDGLALLMDAVREGLGATIQPGSVAARVPPESLAVAEIVDAGARRRNLLACLPDDEVSPAAAAARVALVDTVRQVVSGGGWPGATLHKT